MHFHQSALSSLWEILYYLRTQPTVQCFYPRWFVLWSPVLRTVLFLWSLPKSKLYYQSHPVCILDNMLLLPHLCKQPPWCLRVAFQNTTPSMQIYRWKISHGPITFSSILLCCHENHIEAYWSSSSTSYWNKYEILLSLTKCCETC